MNEQEKDSDPGGAPALRAAIIGVEGMNCGHCAARVKEALAGVAGVSEVVVDLVGKTARVSYDPQAVTTAKLMQAVNGTGFKAAGFVRA